jgi:replication factor C subunit 2/4
VIASLFLSSPFYSSLRKMASLFEAVEKGIHPPRVVPWVEKYRPERVDDVAHQTEVVQTLKKSIESGQVPHLLFHGPPGTGKTTTILALARELYGPQLYRSRILELNASDERGIKVVREKIKTFAQGAVGGQKTPGYPCPRFKLIILDEADTMTPEAQSALRRTIEIYSKVTRFCLVCNYVTRIIEPLASRCGKFRFKPLPIEAMRERIMHIAAKESVQVEEATVTVILDCSNGDMRKAVTLLQSSHQICPAGVQITPELVVDIAGKVPLDIMDALWNSMKKGSTFAKMQNSVMELCYQGFPMSSILSQLYDDVISKPSTGLTDLDKATICDKLAQADQCLLDGSNEEIQLLDVAALIMRRLSKQGNDYTDYAPPH